MFRQAIPCAVSLSIVLLVVGCHAETIDNRSFVSQGKTVTYEEFSGQPTHSCSSPAVIMLHGASGPDGYRARAQFLANNGYRVLLPHYFDVTGSSTPTDKHYVEWAQAVADLIGEQSSTGCPPRRKIALVGFSLGASVALGVSSQDVGVAGTVDWYGSLPDVFYVKLKAMPPLLILHGGQDSIIPPFNAYQLERLCKIKKFDCTLQIYSGDEHGLPKHWRDAEERTLEFLKRVVGQ